MTEALSAPAQLFIGIGFIAIGCLSFLYRAEIRRSLMNVFGNVIESDSALDKLIFVVPSLGFLATGILLVVAALLRML